jgi:hypothetical protein
MPFKLTFDCVVMQHIYLMVYSFGQVISIHVCGELLVQPCLRMDSEMLQQFSLRPIMVANHPLASYDEVCEVYLTLDQVFVEKQAVVDVEFILPIQEVDFFSLVFAHVIFLLIVRWHHVVHPLSQQLHRSHFN